MYGSLMANPLIPCHVDSTHVWTERPITQLPSQDGLGNRKAAGDHADSLVHGAEEGRRRAIGRKQQLWPLRVVRRIDDRAVCGLVWTAQVEAAILGELAVGTADIGPCNAIGASCVAARHGVALDELVPITPLVNP